MFNYINIKDLFLSNYLIPENGQCFYGYLDLKKSNLAALGIKVKNNKEKFILAFGASNTDLVVIPYDNLNQEFALNQKIILRINSLKVNLNKHTLIIKGDNTDLIYLKIDKKIFKDNSYKIDLITFVNRFKENIEAPKVKNQVEEKSMEEKRVEEVIPEVNTNNTLADKDLTYNFNSIIIPSSLLENPEESQIKYLNPFKGEITGNKDKLIISSNGKHIIVLSSRITNVITRKSADLTKVEIWVQSHNENIFKVILDYTDMLNNDLKENICKFINTYYHSGEDLDKIVLKEQKKVKKDNGILLMWLGIAIILGVALYFFLK